jgi:acyl dehydratase
MKFEELKLGMTERISKVFTEQDVLTFAEISKDNNPLHIDEEAAKKGMFGTRVVHGILVASLISAVLGTKLPGVGTIYLGQELKFRKPVYLNDEITAVVEIIELKEDKHIAIFKSTCINQHGVEVITGTSTVMVK